MVIFEKQSAKGCLGQMNIALFLKKHYLD
ncbi:Hypothetical protein EIN_286460, partial [Entamoeba invadens IP1]